MILTIMVSATVLMLTSAVIFVLVRYLPIIANLFMNITVRPDNGRGDEEHVEGETVTFRGSDGVTLTGTLTGSSGPTAQAPVIVFCHEFAANRHSAAKYVRFLKEGGFRVFTFDFRGHGDSGSSTGYVPRQWVTEHEVCDLRAALRYLKGRQDVNGAPMGLFGMSRGAATAIIVAGDESRVVGLVSDGAFSNSHTLQTYMKRWAPIFVDAALLPYSAPRPLFSTIRWMAMKLAEHRLGVRLVSVTPALRRLKVPIFFVHGEKDGYIDTDQVRLLYETVPMESGKELWVVPQAEHNRAVDADPAQYSRRVVRFFRTALGVREHSVTPVCGFAAEQERVER